MLRTACAGLASTRRRMKSVVVTGGTRRIGAAISRSFADDGYRVFAHSRAGASAWHAGAAPQDCPDLNFDLANPADAARRFAAFLAARDPVDVLVLNASTFEPDAFTDISPDNLRFLLRSNLESQILLVHELMRARRTQAAAEHGPAVAIVLLDQKLFNPNPDFFSYTTSKHGLAGIVEMGGTLDPAEGLLIYGLAPGLTLPSHDQTEEEFGISSRMNLLQRQNRPEEIAQACLFLSRGLLRNGSILLSDSGQHLLHQPRDVMYEIRKNAI